MRTLILSFAVAMYGTTTIAEEPTASDVHPQIPPAFDLTIESWLVDSKVDSALIEGGYASVEAYSFGNYIR